MCEDSSRRAPADGVSRSGPCRSHGGWRARARDVRAPERARDGSQATSNQRRASAGDAVRSRCVCLSSARSAGVPALARIPLAFCRLSAAFTR
jgi:hypothetical protein